MSFFEELKRRNVFRVAIAYVVVAWLVTQVLQLVFETFGTPEWVMKTVLALLAVGLLFACFFAWAFEMTPDGLKKESEVDRSQSVTTQTGRKLNNLIVAVMALAIVYLVYDKFVLSSARGTAAAVTTATDEGDQAPRQQPAGDAAVVETEQSVAVLPFVNMSDDAGNEYFSDGISEELLNVLVKVKGLRVPSRTSSFTFKGSDLRVAEIGKALNVDHVLEGSVRKAGNRIRVTAQLIEANTDTHLWSETYTREVDDIFAVQDEIAQAIVGALKLTLSRSDEDSLAQHATDNVEAYNNYLLGRHLWNQRTITSLLGAIEPLKKAVALDPLYDEAWAALADTYVLIPEYMAGPIAEYIPLAREAVEKTLAINPDSARALTTRGYLRSAYDYDFAGANADFTRAIELEPGYATGHQWYGEVLAKQRRFDEALEQARLAREADPLSAIIAGAAAMYLWYGGRPDEALAAFQTARKLDPLLVPILASMEIVYVQTGDYANARLMAAELGRIHKKEQLADLAMIDAMENPALKDQAVEVIQNFQDLPDGAEYRALYLAILGEYELALDNLEKAFEAGDPFATYINLEPAYEPLRDNPRFQALLARMNLWP